MGQASDSVFSEGLHKAVAKAKEPQIGANLSEPQLETTITTRRKLKRERHYQNST
jgi:hypothetical protein